MDLDICRCRAPSRSRRGPPRSPRSPRSRSGGRGPRPSNSSPTCQSCSTSSNWCTGGRRIPCTRSRSSWSRGGLHVPRPSSMSWRGTPGWRRQTPCWASVKLSGRSCSFTDAVAPAVTKEWLAANNGGQRRCRRANTRKVLCRELLALWSLSVQSFETLRSDHAAPMQ